MNSTRRGRTLKLYLVDGTPTGVITAQLGISTIVTTVAPRTDLPELIKRDDAKKTGVYVLAGPDPDDADRLQVYIGETGDVSKRLVEHDSNHDMDFFTRVVFVTSKDENLTKAHGLYLESRLINIAVNAQRASIRNGTQPGSKGLPEAEIADMERVINEIEILLPTLGFDILRPAGQKLNTASTEQVAKDGSVGSEQVVFWLDEAITNAMAKEVEGEFIVLANSLARKDAVPSCPAHSHLRRQTLLNEGKLLLADDDRFLKFAVDVAFQTPSAAAGVVYGGSSNGRDKWKVVGTNQTYAAYRSSLLTSQQDSLTTEDVQNN